jgi:hypothetical protein
MAGRIVTSTLNNDTGVLATQNGMTGIAKAWVNYNASAQTIRGSFNISSVTYNGTGNYTLNFTTAMPDANYAITGTGQTNDAGTSANIIAIQNGSTPTTSAVQIRSLDQNIGFVNPARVCAAIFSS